MDEDLITAMHEAGHAVALYVYTYEAIRNRHFRAMPSEYVVEEVVQSAGGSAVRCQHGRAWWRVDPPASAESNPP